MLLMANGINGGRPRDQDTRAWPRVRSGP